MAVAGDYINAQPPTTEKAAEKPKPLQTPETQKDTHPLKQFKKRIDKWVEKYLRILILWAILAPIGAWSSLGEGVEIGSVDCITMVWSIVSPY